MEVLNLILSRKNFFLYLHYESIHTGILNTVLKAYNNFSKEYFEKKKENAERYAQILVEYNVLLKALDKVLKKISSTRKEILFLETRLTDNGVKIKDVIKDASTG